MHKSLFILLAILLGCKSSGEKIIKPNFLFIIVDDLRPALGTYGYPEVISPNIDNLAASGVQFNRSYCNVPVCGASRASFLTGLRPHFPERFVDYRSWAEKECPTEISLPGHLKNKGYTTLSNGKVFHHSTDKKDESWSTEPWEPDTISIINFSNVNYFDSTSLQYINPKKGAGPYFEAADVPDSLYRDARLTQKSIADLQQLAKKDQPFFLGVGYAKPHLPFNAPKKYFDLYDSVSIATNRYRPEDLPEPVINSSEIFTYGRLEDFNSTRFHHEAKKAYMACVSFIDSQIGDLLQSLKDLNLDDNTVVVLVGDHGWHLGEHNFWGKHNTLHNALQTPLIVKLPGNKESFDVNELVEYVDLYPTICELSGIELPEHKLHGQSFATLLRKEEVEWKKEIFAEWKGARTVVTDRYAYTEWSTKKDSTERMLFDYQIDPEENVNVVNNERYADVVAYHKSKIDSLYNSGFEEFKRK